MNVALTRARDILVVVGHMRTLASVEGPWRRFVAYAAQEGDFTIFREGVECVQNVDKGMNVFQQYKGV
jgi:superfamily I DNA and/or RNA helicase